MGSCRNLPTPSALTIHHSVKREWYWARCESQSSLFEQYMQSLFFFTYCCFVYILLYPSYLSFARHFTTVACCLHLPRFYHIDINPCLIYSHKLEVLLQRCTKKQLKYLIVTKTRTLTSPRNKKQPRSQQQSEKLVTATSQRSK